MSETIISNNTWCVYMHINIVNNKVYIGQTCKQPPEHRWGNGSGYREDTQPVFYRAIQKYGWENFEHRIVAEGLTKEEANQMEIELIAEYKSNCHRYNNPSYGYNMTDGGEGSVGHKHSDTTRAILSEIAKERFKDPQNCPMFGKCHTDEARKKIGDGHRNPPNETRNKMSESAKARCTEEWREWMRQRGKLMVGENNPNYGKHHSEESKQKMMMANKRRKEVIQYDLDGNILAAYNSINEATRITGISKYRIITICENGPKPEDVYDWKYRKENDT